MITILGPTATGKTNLAVALAAILDTEIISGDSRQVYRRMDIGTGKDLRDYYYQGKLIPYHLIDVAEPGTKYTVYNFQHDFLNAYEQIRKKGKEPVFCGGSGLYLESVLRSYRLSSVPINLKLRESLKNRTLQELTKILSSYKKLHNNTDVDTCTRAIRAIEIEDFYQENPVNDREFPEIKSTIIGVSVSREVRRARITKRLQERMQEGMIKEVRNLIESGIKPEDMIYYGLEYKYLTLYLLNELSYSEMFRQLEIAIHQFSKRQMTWFRGMERRGPICIHWIDGELPMNKKIKQVLELAELL